MTLFGTKIYAYVCLIKLSIKNKQCCQAPGIINIASTTLAFAIFNSFGKMYSIILFSIILFNSMDINSEAQNQCLNIAGN